MYTRDENKERKRERERTISELPCIKGRELLCRKRKRKRVKRSEERNEETNERKEGEIHVLERETRYVLDSDEALFIRVGCRRESKKGWREKAMVREKEVKKHEVEVREMIVRKKEKEREERH